MSEKSYKYKRGELTLKILEIIAAGAKSVAEVLSAMAPVYTPSQRRRRARIRERLYYREMDRQKLYSLIHRLKKEGLVKTPSPFGWITKEGKERIEDLRNRLSKKKVYPKEDDTQITIVTFDIPEKRRGERDWVRSVLKNLGFQMLQKSVFIGKTKIPYEFIEDIDKKNIIHYIQIFSLGKSGTLTDYIDQRINKVFRRYY